MVVSGSWTDGDRNVRDKGGRRQTEHAVSPGSRRAARHGDASHGVPEHDGMGTLAEAPQLKPRRDRVGVGPHPAVAPERVPPQTPDYRLARGGAGENRQVAGPRRGDLDGAAAEALMERPSPENSA